MTNELFTSRASDFWLNIARMFYYSTEPTTIRPYKKAFGPNTLRLKIDLNDTIKVPDPDPANASGFYYPRALYTFEVDDVFRFTFYTETKAAFRALRQPFQDLTIGDPVLTLLGNATEELAVDMMTINWKLAAKPWEMAPHFYYE